MQKGTLIAVIIIIIVLCGLGGVSFYLYKSGYFDRKSEIQQPIPKVNNFIEMYDYYTKENIGGIKYILIKLENVVECIDKDSLKLYNANRTKFYNLNPFFVDKNINASGCYVKDMLRLKDSEGELSKGLNLIQVEPTTSYLFYYYNSGYYIGIRWPLLKFFQKGCLFLSPGRYCNGFLAFRR